jgi:hypothetical protein
MDEAASYFPSRLSLVGAPFPHSHPARCQRPALRASTEVSCAIHGGQGGIVPADGADGAGGAGPWRLAASAPMEAACASFRGRAMEAGEAPTRSRGHGGRRNPVPPLCPVPRPPWGPLVTRPAAATSVRVGGAPLRRSPHPCAVGKGRKGAEEPAGGAGERRVSRAGRGGAGRLDR